MIDLGKKNILGVLVNGIDYEATVEKVIFAANNNQSFGISALAVHGLMTGVLDPVHNYRLNKFNLIVPDGQPVRWALNWLYNARLPDRVYGPNLTLYLCARAAKEALPVYFYGSRPEVLDALQNNLKRKFPQLIIAGTQPSQFRAITVAEKQLIIETIHQSGAKILFVGLGCPRQEIWIYEHLGLLKMPMVAVGAAFDFHAGLLSQAPVWMQNWGLEWFYRLTQEPQRLWRRYFYLNPLYLSYLLMQALHLKKFAPENLPPPRDNLNYG